MSEDLIRRIDADALMQEIMKARASLQMLDNTQSADKMLQGLRMVEILVENAPTIEPKRGEWVDLNDKWGFEGTFKCSACGELWSLIDGTPQDNGMNFCPNCGARMKGADDEDN